MKNPQSMKIGTRGHIPREKILTRKPVFTLTGISRAAQV